MGGGAAPTPAPFAGMQQTGIKQAMDGRGFEPVAMATGYVPRGDSAAANAAMLQAQTAPAQFSMTQMPPNVPTIGAGLQGMMMNPTAMNQGMYSSGGAAATGGLEPLGAPPPQPYTQPTMQSAAQQLVFTPVAGAGGAVDESENPSVGESLGVGETRGRVVPPPCPPAPAVRLAVRVWESKWLRELAVDEAAMHAELDGSEVRTLMKLGEEQVYPPAAFVGGAIKWCRASSGQRTAAVVKWLHKSFGTCVMVRAVAGLVWPGRKTLDLPLVDHLRDAVLEAFPCALNVPFEDDYE